MNTGFHTIHPFPAFLYYAGTLLFVLLFVHPLFLVTAVIMMLLLWLLVDQNREKKQLLIAYLIMAAIVLLLNPLFNRRGSTILFYLFDQNVTLEAIVYGGMMALMLLAVFVTFLSYNYVLTADKMMYLFSSYLPRSALVLRMAMRNVPLLLRRWQQIVLVQRTLGYSFTTGSVQQRARFGLRCLSILLSWSFEEAVISARSMHARGYGIGRRTTYVRYLLRRDDVSLLWLLALLGVLLLTGWLLGEGQLVVYPALGSVGLSPFGWLIYGSFCCYLSIPILIELKEIDRWRSLK
jgi:energy-coupling factor transport system permease protein